MGEVWGWGQRRFSGAGGIKAEELEGSRRVTAGGNLSTVILAKGNRAET